MKKIIDWTTICSQANDILTHDPTVEAFRQAMRTLFAAMLEGSKLPHLRRPIASLRLICHTVPA